MRKLLPLFAISYIFLGNYSLAKTITVKPGDTLSTISAKYKVPVRKLMDLNRIYNADKLTVGQKIILPEPIKDKIEDSGSKHTVKEGESISVIAFMYKTNAEDIATLNGIYDPSFIYIGQVLKLPKGSIINNVRTGEKMPSYHVVNKGETLGMISRSYNISLMELVNINSLNQPNSISPGDTIYLKEGSYRNTVPDVRERRTLDDDNRETKLSKSDDNDWRTYGSLQINWSNWKTLDNSYVAPALNKKGNPLFVAVNCKSTKINSTGRNNRWKEWFSPNNDFEFDLIDDRCDK